MRKTEVYEKFLWERVKGVMKIDKNSLQLQKKFQTDNTRRPTSNTDLSVRRLLLSEPAPHYRRPTAL